MNAVGVTAPMTRADLRAVPAPMPAEQQPVHVIAAPDEAHERVARALRGARARTGLGEQQVVDKLVARGCEFSLTALRRAESAGALELALASALADLYGMTTDCLSGRRLNRQSLQPQPLLRA
jgi:hypothetical protein